MDLVVRWFSSGALYKQQVYLIDFLIVRDMTFHRYICNIFFLLTTLRLVPHGVNAAFCIP